jgi:hypothetical protein
MDEREKLTAERDALRAALKPFAAIKPSSFFAEDGSENERYDVILTRDYSGQDHAFTGVDLARARAALADV